MPSVFKALASITGWVLFIFGLLALLGGFIRILGASVGISGTPELLKDCRFETVRNQEGYKYCPKIIFYK